MDAAPPQLSHSWLRARAAAGRSLSVRLPSPLMSLVLCALLPGIIGWQNRTIVTGSAVMSVVWDRAGGNVTTALVNTLVRSWDVLTGEPTCTLQGHTTNVYTVAYSPDGRYLASGSGDSAVKIWDTATGDCLHTLTRALWTR
jgi:WD40 repeat protein